MEQALIAAETVHYLRTVAWLVFGERHTLPASFIAGACDAQHLRSRLSLQAPYDRRSSFPAMASIQPSFNPCRSSRAQRFTYWR